MTPASSALAYIGTFDFAQPRAALIGHHLTRFMVALGLTLGLGLSNFAAPETSGDTQPHVEAQA